LSDLICICDSQETWAVVRAVRTTLRDPGPMHDEPNRLRHHTERHHTDKELR